MRVMMMRDNHDEDERSCSVIILSSDKRVLTKLTFLTFMLFMKLKTPKAFLLLMNSFIRVGNMTGGLGFLPPGIKSCRLNGWKNFSNV